MDINISSLIPTALHPVVVHFPIALLVTAALFDSACLVFRRYLWLDRAATALLILGGIGLGAAYLTGGRAKELAAPVTGNAQGILAEHENLALLTLGAVCAAALFKLFVTWLGRHDLRVQLGIFRIAALILIYGTVFLLVVTAHYGGQLVYDHGIGVNLG